MTDNHIPDLDRLESAARGELGAKSLGEKLHAADMEHEHPGSIRPWIDLSDEGRAVWERIALAFAASLTHDETANAVTLSLISALRASEAERDAAYAMAKGWKERFDAQAETIRELVGALKGARSTLDAIAGPLTADAPARGAAANAVKRIDACIVITLSRTRPSGGDAKTEQSQ